eukprot:TRINITY_DN2070_c0_g1_i1.p1 TRINITY_DN2070_c0_g1~~TRINITY_DN2070_c0_g1_i1.p1  ORF type:complete len:835 (-),score=64.68 TRINITY_DN2070_c0_g1_i1:160-2322(-)
MRLELAPGLPGFVTHEVNTLVLAEGPAHPDLKVIEHHDNETSSSNHNILITISRIGMVVLTIQMVLLIVYFFAVLKQIFRCGFSLLRSTISTARAFWVFLWKPEGVAVRKMAAQRRVLRAQLLISYSVHFVALWAAMGLYQRRGTYKYPWMHFDVEAVRKYSLMIMDSELIPMSFVLAVSVCAQVRPIRSAFVLDALTVLFAFVIALQHYLMTQSISGLNVDLYLYNASWMLMMHMCINLAIGRAMLTVPCTIIVTIVDVYCFDSLMTLNRSHNFIFGNYSLKQYFVCLMLCIFQISFDVLRGREIHAAVAVNSANLHEQLATRLTDCMCDAVVHLDSSLNLAKPAPKLGHMLFRDKLGIIPVNFLKFVMPDDHGRFENYMKYAESADAAETLIPQHFTLLDSSGSFCKVQLFVSAFYDDDKTIHYILGISETVDFQCKKSPISARFASDNSRHGHAPDIPEASVVDSSDGEIGVESSKASEGTVEQHAPMMEVSICRSTGNILRFNSIFLSWVKVACRAKHFPSLFHDPSDVWMWLQTAANRLGPVHNDGMHDVQRKTFTSVRRDAIIEVELMILDATSQVDGVTALDLNMRIVKRYTKSTTKRRSSREARAQPAAPTLRAVGPCIDSAMEAAQELAEQTYKPILAKRWGEWMNWWNLCNGTIENAPFQSSQGDFKMELVERGPDDFVVSLQLLPAAVGRAASDKHIEASTIGLRTLPL